MEKTILLGEDNAWGEIGRLYCTVLGFSLQAKPSIGEETKNRDGVASGRPH